MTTTTIDPAAAPDIFRRIGKLAARHETISAGGTRCCLLAALYIDGHRDEGHDRGTLARVALGRAAGLTPSYRCGAIWGWDGHGEGDVPPALLAGLDMGQWRAGHRSGAAAWRACEAAGVAATDDRDEAPKTAGKRPAGRGSWRK